MRGFWSDIWFWVLEGFWSTKNFFRSFARTLKYRKVVGYSYDWDFAYLLDLVRFHLSKMEIYFRVNGIAEKSTLTANRIKLAINLMDVVQEDVPHLSWGSGGNWTFNHPLNTKNWARFWESEVDFNPSNALHLSELYYNKAWHTLFLVLEHNMRDWWD